MTERPKLPLTCRAHGPGPRERTTEYTNNEITFDKAVFTCGCEVRVVYVGPPAEWQLIETIRRNEAAPD